MKSALLVIFTLFVSGLDSSKILILHPSFSKSHVIPLQALAVVLAEKGHEVTFFSPYPLSKPVKNYREFKVAFNETLKEELMSNMGTGGGFMSTLTVMPEMFALIRGASLDTLYSKDMQKLMKEEKFDLMILGYLFNDYLLGIANHFECPSVMFSPAGAFAGINQALGNPSAIEGAAHLMLANKKMDFLGRLMNLFANGFEYSMTLLMKKINRRVYEENFPADRYRSYDETLQSVSLSLINTHFSYGGVRPMLPNLVEVGGLQVKPKPSPLPEKLKLFLDGAKDGAILFSLGSNAKSTLLSKEVISALLKVFSGLKHRVVMKWEADTLEGKPDNVFISKWLPQDDVLAHSNIKAFISHCGLGGVVESKYHGVPIIGIPLFADQHGNAEEVVKEGWGVKLELSQLTEETLRNALREVLDDSKFANIAKQFSNLSKDRPMNAQDTAIFWLEYIIRHRGAPHMHYPGADLNFFQYNSIDVILFIVAIIYIVFKSIAFVCKKICCGRKSPPTDQSSKSKKQKRN